MSIVASTALTDTQWTGSMQSWQLWPVSPKHGVLWADDKLNPYQAQTHMLRYPFCRWCRLIPLLIRRRTAYLLGTQYVRQSHRALHMRQNALCTTCNALLMCLHQTLRAMLWVAWTFCRTQLHPHNLASLQNLSSKCMRYSSRPQCVGQPTLQRFRQNGFGSRLPTGVRIMIARHWKKQPRTQEQVLVQVLTVS